MSNKKFFGTKVLGMTYLPTELVENFELKSSVAVITEQTMNHIRLERHRGIDMYDLLFLLQKENIAFVGMQADGSLKIVSRAIDGTYIAIAIRDTIIRTAYYASSVYVKHQYEQAEILPVDELFIAM